jgi:hypothetical protein
MDDDPPVPAHSGCLEDSSKCVFGLALIETVAFSTPQLLITSPTGAHHSRYRIIRDRSRLLLAEILCQILLRNDVTSTEQIEDTTKPCQTIDTKA